MRDVILINADNIAAYLEDPHGQYRRDARALQKKRLRLISSKPNTASQKRKKAVESSKNE